MKTIVIQILFACILLGVLVPSTIAQNCTRTYNINYNKKDNSTSVITFANLDERNFYLHVESGSLSSDTAEMVGQYEPLNGFIKDVCDWTLGSEMYFYFEGTSLYSSQNLDALQGAGMGAWRDAGDQVEIKIYGVGGSDPDQPSNTLVTFAKPSADLPGALMSLTYGYELQNQSTDPEYTLTNYNDVIEFKENRIFRIEWLGPGSTGCQDFPYLLKITF